MKKTTTWWRCHKNTKHNTKIWMNTEWKKHKLCFFFFYRARDVYLFSKTTLIFIYNEMHFYKFQSISMISGNMWRKVEHFHAVFVIFFWLFFLLLVILVCFMIKKRYFIRKSTQFLEKRRRKIIIPYLCVYLLEKQALS